MSKASFKCPCCGQMFEGPDEYLGRKMKCSKCGNTFVLKRIDVAVAELPSAISWYFAILKKYFDFKGRARRREFWWSFLFHVLVCIILAVICGYIKDGSDVILGIYSLAMVVPLLAVQVRRLHDTNKNGWWFLLSILPIVNIAYVVWLATDGDKSENRFGADPKGRQLP